MSHSDQSAETCKDAVCHDPPGNHIRSGIGAAVIGQNYLPADVNAGAVKQPVPVTAQGAKQKIIGYDGQIGNRIELARRFDIQGDAFQEERLLLDLHSRYGVDMLSHLRDAIFAFVIWDEDQGLTAARDLLGIKTLFYARENSILYFLGALF